MTVNTEDQTEAGRQAPDRLAQAAGGVAQEAGRVAETKASETMTQIGDTLEQVAQVVRDAGEGIRMDRPEIAGVADTAAEQVERSSRYMREHDAREVMEAVQDAARRQPVAVVAGGLALGLAVGRLLRSTGGSRATSASRYVGTSHPGYGGYDSRASASGYGGVAGSAAGAGTASVAGSGYSGETRSYQADAGGTASETAWTGRGTDGSTSDRGDVTNVVDEEA
jgi:hypothetical protein